MWIQYEGKYHFLIAVDFAKKGELWSTITVATDEDNGRKTFLLNEEGNKEVLSKLRQVLAERAIVLS